MAKIAKDFLLIALFFILTISLYSLYTITLPLFSEPHGLLVVSQLSDFPRISLFFGFLFGSACVCVLLGVIIMNWVTVFPPGVMANLWASTYLFLWMDSVFTLSVQMKSLMFLFSLAMGLVFIYLFFFLVNYLGVSNKTTELILVWKFKIVTIWLWGWMGFYLGISCFLIYYSFYSQGLRLSLAVASMIICFLNYLLFLFLRKAEGKDVGSISKIGRIVFAVWIFSLFFVWFGQRWMS
jgi:hypothetical protein